MRRSEELTGGRRTSSRALRAAVMRIDMSDCGTTTLPERRDATQIIALYADQRTHERFHAEFKTDLDLTLLRCDGL